MPRALPACLLPAAVFASLPAPVARAVVIRHDRADADALAAGAPFEAAGRVDPDGGCTLVSPRWAITAAHVAAECSHGRP